MLSYIAAVSWTGLEALDEHLTLQRHYVAEKVPSYERLLHILAELIAGPEQNRLRRAWQNRRFFAPYERPALLMAALRWAALSDGEGHPLFSALVFPALPDEISPSTVSAALRDERIFDILARRTVQTNETSRAVLWSWTAEMIASRVGNATFSLFDVGASAGLNLVADKLPAIWFDQRDQALLPARSARVVERIGFDSARLDVNDPDDERWLTACVWPGQTKRIERLAAAVAAFREYCVLEPRPIVVETCGASEAVARIRPEGTHAILYQSLVRDYLEPKERERYETAVAQWLYESPGHRFWVELEIVDHNGPPCSSAAIVVHLVKDGSLRSIETARCHPHPDRLIVDWAAAAEFLKMLG